MSNWIEEYVFLLARNCESQAQLLKQSKFPSALFKYRALNDKTLEALKNSVVWMSSAEMLNDPYEATVIFDEKKYINFFFSQPAFRIAFYLHTKSMLTIDEINKMLDSADYELELQEICKKRKIPWKDSLFDGVKLNAFNIFQEYNRKRIKICSFSEISDSILMWSHYANDHKGICIEYDFKGIDKLISTTEPVYYSERGFDLNPFTNSILENPALLKLSGMTKPKEWEYEKEWRIIFPSEIEPAGGYYKVPIPITIFLGSRFSENEKKLQESFYEISNLLAIPLIKLPSVRKDFKITRK